MHKLKRIIPLGLLVVLASSCISDNSVKKEWISPVTGKKYQLVFNDEFNSEKNLSDYWDFRGSGWTTPVTRKIKFGNKEYTIAAVKSAVSVNKGNLELSVFRKDGITDTIYTGGLSTISTFRPQYGYFETKVNFSGCMDSWGHWPAFWLMYTFPQEESLPENYDMFTQATEIDIFEFISQSEKIFTTLHWRIKDTVSADPGPIGLHGSETYAFHLDSTRDRWHVISVEWTPEELIWFCDGAVVLRRNINENKRYVPSSFEYVCFSMSAGIWGGNVADPKNNLPAKVKYDYCRVYQQPQQKAYYKLPVIGKKWVLLSPEERINNKKYQVNNYDL